MDDNHCTNPSLWDEEAVDDYGYFDDGDGDGDGYGDNDDNGDYDEVMLTTMMMNPEASLIGL